jgi:hypothetical protein
MTLKRKIIKFYQKILYLSSIKIDSHDIYCYQRKKGWKDDFIKVI